MRQDIKRNSLNYYLHSTLKSASLKFYPSLGTSDHSQVSFKVDIQPKVSSDVPFHRTIFWYTKADLYSFRFYMAKASLSGLFKHTDSKIATLNSEKRVLMVNFI